jgi:hypothetical protein
MVSDTRVSVNAKNSKDPSGKDPEELSQLVYELLCDVRDAATRNLDTRLSAADFGDLTGDELLILAATPFRGAVEVVIPRLGITRQTANQSIETLILRGYLKPPDGPSQSAVVITETGLEVLALVKRGLDEDLWTQFPLRSDDIVISTVRKSGTTWMQMICALLIFQTPRLPARLQELSPRMQAGFGRSETYAELAAQQHRRFIKTHSPLNELPADPRVTYIVVARHPLDTVVSRYYHQQNSGEQEPGTARQWILGQINKMGGRDSDFDDMLKHLSCAWERRNEPNIVLVHYEDLSVDLSGEMRRLAARLDITVPEDKWPGLVEAATFKEMRAAADQLQPLETLRTQGVSERFFRRGSSGEGRALITEAEAARYRTRAARVAPQDLLAWLHRDDKP